MVSVVGAPSERKFGQVACSDHDATHLARKIHEYLGAFARLAVLVCQIVHALVLPYVFEVPARCRHYRNFAVFSAEKLHQPG